MATSKFPPKLNLSDGVLDAVETHAYSNLNAEVGGMLIGDVTEGITNIVGFVPATSASAEQISLTFTHDVWAEILSVVNRDFPDFRIVGWYHTHPSFGLFLSQYDEFIQRNFFGEPGQVALVIDPIAGELAWFVEKGKKIEEFGKTKTRRGPVRRPEIDQSDKVKKTNPVQISLIAAGAAVISGLLVWGITQTTLPPNTTLALQESKATNIALINQIAQQSADFDAIRQAPVLVYKFEEGDDFTAIVLRFYGTDETEMVLRVNNLESADLVVAGTMLKLPSVPSISISVLTNEEVNPPPPTPSPTPSTTPTTTPAPEPTPASTS